MRLGQILKRSRQILKRSNQISTRSRRISTDRTKSDWQTTPINGESYFQCVFRSGQLKISFPCSNPLIDLPISGFGSRDPPPTVANVGSAGSRARLARLSRWVRYRVWLDTPTHTHTHTHTNFLHFSLLYHHFSLSHFINLISTFSFLTLSLINHFFCFFFFWLVEENCKTSCTYILFYFDFFFFLRQYIQVFFLLDFI